MKMENDFPGQLAAALGKCVPEYVGHKKLLRWYGSGEVIRWESGISFLRPQLCSGSINRANFLYIPLNRPERQPVRLDLRPMTNSLATRLLKFSAAG